jgi:hypothetical protein
LFFLQNPTEPLSVFADPALEVLMLHILQRRKLKYKEGNWFNLNPTTNWW